jgi:hypothetical protein
MARTFGGSLEVQMGAQGEDKEKRDIKEILGFFRTKFIASGISSSGIQEMMF